MAGAAGRLALALVFVVVASTWAPVAAGQDQVTLTVTVVDADGEPVADVDLSATWDGGGPVNETTRSNGQALVDVAAGANVTIRVHDDRYVRNVPFEVDNASERDVEVPVRLSGSAGITITDGDSPISNAVVQVSRSGTFVLNARTDDAGRVETGDVERGEYVVRAWKAGYLRNRTSVTVDGDVAHRVTLERGSTLLQVDVTDDHFDPAEPVEGATVEVEGVGTVSTLANGETTIQVPVNDEYEVTVTKDGYRTNTTTVAVREDDTTTAVTIQREPGITVEPGNDRVVVGESVRLVVTDEYGDPVADVAVSLDGEAAGRTDENGVVSVPVESAGTLEVSAEKGSLEASATVEGVEPGADPTETDTATANATESATPAVETTAADGPGFTLGVTVVALLVASVLLRRR